jgi:hypothetical protein
MNVTSPDLAAIVTEELTAHNFARVLLTNGWSVEIEIHKPFQLFGKECGGSTTVSLCHGDYSALLYQAKGKPLSSAVDSAIAKVIEWFRPKTEPADLAPF